MQFHYALVDDLFSREEFDSRVEKKMHECGDMVDETTASMLVVEDCGRHHVKISGLDAKSSLFSFFGKVISKSEIKEFLRPDGENGLVTNIILGDETGQTKAVLWDEKAMAAGEIDIGDVLEVIGRRTSRSATDITVLAIRKAMCEIQCKDTVEPYLSPPQRKEIEVCLIAREEPRAVSKRDGTTVDLCEGVVGIEENLCRLVCWEPDLISDLPEGTPLRITNALEKIRQKDREFVIDDKSTVEISDRPIEFRCSTLDEVGDQGTYSVTGTVESIQPARQFTARDGRISHVRNLFLTDGEKKIRVVVWGDRALLPILPGERIAVYLGQSRVGKYDDLELHLGSRGFVRVIPEECSEEIEMCGTIISTSQGTFIDDGNKKFLVNGNFPHGYEFCIRGILCGQRLTPSHAEPVRVMPGEIKKRIDTLLAEAGHTNTFTVHGREHI
ncbi:MAG TPA: nucleic acid-binding protein [Methanoregulaceae archaeon]|nr:nucleic acid-binding protein [Methanoregulaceae archaeon]